MRRSCKGPGADTNHSVNASSSKPISGCLIHDKDENLPTDSEKESETSDGLKLLALDPKKLEWKAGEAGKYVELEESESKFIEKAIPDSSEGKSKSEDRIYFSDCQVDEDEAKGVFDKDIPKRKCHDLLGVPLDNLEHGLDKCEQFWAEVVDKLEKNGRESLANHLNGQISELQNMKEVLVDTLLGSDNSN
jgi:hypothetical protein